MVFLKEEIEKPSGVALTNNLVVSVQGEEPVQYVLNADRIGLGRGPDNQIQLKNPSVSYSHLELRKNGAGGYELNDLGSSNGVRVNGKKVAKAALNDGDRMLIGGKVAAYFMVLPENADPEDFFIRPANSDQAKIRQYFDLAERTYELKGSLKADRKRSEGLKKEIELLETERIRRQELCESLAKAVSETLKKIHTGPWRADGETITRPAPPLRARIQRKAIAIGQG